MIRQCQADAAAVSPKAELEDAVIAVGALCAIIMSVIEPVV